MLVREAATSVHAVIDSRNENCTPVRTPQRVLSIAPGEGPHLSRSRLTTRTERPPRHR